MTNMTATDSVRLREIVCEMHAEIKRITEIRLTEDTPHVMPTLMVWRWAKQLEAALAAGGPRVEPCCEGGYAVTTFDCEEDGRVIATVKAVAYGATQAEAERHAIHIAASHGRFREALALPAEGRPEEPQV